MPGAGASEMDVSRVDPEEVLVDAGTVEVGDGDVSGDIDVADLHEEEGREDKVLVSIRCAPSYRMSSMY